MKTKIVAVTFLWVTILFSAFFVLDEILTAQSALFIVGFGVSVHLVRLPNLKK